MQKIGMHFEKEFDHPLVEQGALVMQTYIV